MTTDYDFITVGGGIAGAFCRSYVIESLTAAAIGCINSGDENRRRSV